MKISLKTPKDHAIVSQLSKKHLSFLERGGNRTLKNGDEIDWLHLKKQGEDNSYPNPILFAWEINGLLGEACETCLVLSKDREFSDCYTVKCKGNSYEAFNLLLGKDYFWKVFVIDQEETIESEIYHFTTACTPPRWIKAEGLSNVRDLGGWPVQGGKRIKQGLVYRGCEMEFHHEITEEGKNTLLHELNIKTDLDLRIEAVGKVPRSALGEQVKHVLIPTKAYADFLEEQDVCKQLFQLFLDKNMYPCYIHCWGGADRTGTLLFLLGAILGMSQQDLFLDYELTSFSIWGERNAASEQFSAFLSGLDAYGTEQDSIHTKCKYFILSTGITQEEIDSICNFLTEEPGDIN